MPAPSVAPTISLLPLYHCQEMLAWLSVPNVVGIGQGGHDFHTHLGLQRGQGHRSGFLHVGDRNGHFFRSGRVFSAVGCLDRNYVGVVGVCIGGSLKVGGTLETQHPVLYVRSPPLSPTLSSNDQTIDSPSGSTAVKVATAPVPFSAYLMAESSWA